MPKAIPLGDVEVEVPLQDWIPGAAEVKSDLPLQLGSLKKSGYSVRFQRPFEVHGQFEDDSKDDASLLVLKILPTAKSTDKSFGNFKVTVAIEAAEGSDPNDEPPYIVSYEPGVDGGVYFSEDLTNVSLEKKIEGKLSVAPPVGGTSGDLTASKSRTEEFTRKKLHKLSSGSDCKDADVTNVAWWLLEPATKAEGIGDVLTVALLIRRAEGSKFMVRVDTEADVGFGAKVSEAFNRRKIVKFGPFGPASSGAQTKLPDKVDINNLHASSTDEILKTLAYVHVPERVESRKFFNVVDANSTTAPAMKPASVPELRQPSVGFQEPFLPSISATPVVKQAITGSGSELSYRSASTPSNSRAIRHRKMAALYHRLAQLHREEAEELAAIEEAAYVSEIEQAELAAEMEGVGNGIELKT